MSVLLPTVSPSSEVPTVSPSSEVPTVSPSSEVPTVSPSSEVPTSRAWLGEDDIRRLRSIALRAQRRRNSSYSSLSTVSEYDMLNYEPERRGSAPEWEHISRFLLSRRSSQTMPDNDWGHSGRRGSCPPIRLGMDNDQYLPYGMTMRMLERDRLLLRRQSLQNGEFKWGESTMTMDATTSMGATVNGRQLKFKIILLGDSGVGKSSFLQTLMTGKYTASMPNTNLTMSSVVRMVQYKGQDVELDFCDTAGQERYRSITASYYRHAQGCLIFFNVHYRLSFEHIESWLDDLNKYGKRDNMALVLVGLTHKHVRRHRQEVQNGSNDSLAAGTTKSWSTKSWSELDIGLNKRAVPRAQAEHLASRCLVPYVEADIQNDPSSISNTIHKLLDLLMFRAVQDQPKSLSIKPKQSDDKSNCCNYC